MKLIVVLIRCLTGAKLSFFLSVDCVDNRLVVENILLCILTPLSVKAGLKRETNLQI